MHRDGVAASYRKETLKGENNQINQKQTKKPNQQQQLRTKPTITKKKVLSLRGWSVGEGNPSSSSQSPGASSAVLLPARPKLVFGGVFLILLIFLSLLYCV